MNRTQMKKVIRDLNEIVRKNNACMCMVFIEKTSDGVFEVKVNTYKNGKCKQKQVDIIASDFDEAIQKSKKFIPDGCTEIMHFTVDYNEM